MTNRVNRRQGKGRGIKQAKPTINCEGIMEVKFKGFREKDVEFWTLEPGDAFSQFHENRGLDVLYIKTGGVGAAPAVRVDNGEVQFFSTGDVVCPRLKAVVHAGPVTMERP